MVKVRTSHHLFAETLVGSLPKHSHPSLLGSEENSQIAKFRAR